MPRRLLVIAALAAGALSSLHAVDIDFDNSSGDGNWNNPANWTPLDGSLERVPTGGDDAVLIDPALTAVIDADIPALRDIRFGTDGRAGGGTVNHTAGLAQVNGWVRMGITSGSSGTYNLSGGELRAGSFKVAESQNTTSTVDVSGSGILSQVNTDNAENAWNQIGQGGSSSTEFNLSGGGLVSLDARTIFANQPGSSTTVNQTGGIFEVRQGEVNIGDLGTAVYNLSGGTMRTLNAGSIVTVGQWDGGNGRVLVSGTGQMEVAGSLQVGAGRNGFATTGAIEQTGGKVTVGTELVLGNSTTATGTYDLSGGTLNLTNGLLRRGAGSGTFNFTGGRLEDPAAVGFPLNQQGGVLAPGATGAAGTTTVDGAYSLSATGTLEINITTGVADLLTVNGVVTLGGNLDIVASGALGDASSFTIINNDGTEDAVVGMFLNRPGGVPFNEDGRDYTIFYNGGDGNDVVLVPEPTAVLIVLGGAGLGLLLRRRRSHVS